MEVFFWEWSTYALRWMHAIAGIVWLGFFFHTRELDRAMLRHSATQPNAVGEAWSIRGFGIYRTVKYLSKQDDMPPEKLLVWYKWPNIVTIITGFLLLSLIYYSQAELYLTDVNVLVFPAWQAISLSICGILLALIFHESLYRTALKRNEKVILIINFTFLTGLSFFYSNFFSGRGTFMQMGATLGLYVTSYFFINILPSLHKLLKDPTNSRPSPAKLQWFLMRARHNNYLVLTVVFMMLAMHFPLAHSGHYSWGIIPLIIMIGAVIRHYFDTFHETGKRLVWPWAVAVSLALSVIFLSALGAMTHQASQTIAGSTQPFSLSAETILLSRCSMCHARNPAWVGINLPPNGVVLETKDDMEHWASEIEKVAVLSSAMPPGNITGITHEERVLLGQWVMANVNKEKLLF
ncbi:urate hydroxylase PuuD [Zooshikella sp. RANM57]|uniref:urate hydroxylase PuuD n=1 Tax=Zooshikella sp. RANM57 TaxID=3425863 RepID=UPI003D6EE00F